ncbi:hypothetical protein ACOSP7_033065 [Xanthoceras sorbifolium]|uniref:Clp R domain-containing protein n=1 Tax=Xanthoceras sorbifolium TaxID=99658 RepID=A0ABQ8H346_9ROSI|nr:hypothetical protein JRO89_XS14G0007100 [Xanthoceras sorbifolium]
MRAGLCTVPQALTSEAASMVKQAINLARRRGHAQVTPLHVASAMLASSTSLLRRACLQSHSHPLQCKALELCFNVALNRLPASSSSPLLGPHLFPRPSLSNALVAAFKRAQANQRRGTIENQQQPILALKIELEQLIISMLDDPSVSRVMREAGFSSSQVRNMVEQDVSLEICSQTSPPPPVSSRHQSREQLRNEDDVMSVLYTLMKQGKNSVIVGGCQADLEGIINRFERGQVPGDLRYAQFISLQLFSLRNLPKQEIEKKLKELRCLVKSYMGRGVVLYLGDLKWVSEFWSSCGEQSINYYYAVEYIIIMELKRLVSEIAETNQKLWLIGTSSFQTYIRCRAGQPSLETMWKLCPLTIPVGSLRLGLNLDSDLPTQFTSKVPREGSSWSLFDSGADNHQNWCKKEFATTSVSSNLTLPPWLQQYKEESRRNTINDQECVEFGDLCKQRKHPEKVLNFSSHLSWPSKQLPKEHKFFISEISNEEDHESSLMRNYPIPDLLSNPNSSPNSASSSEAEEDTDDGLDRFKVFNDENLKILCDALKRKVPWQKEVIPEIAKTILQCRSGMSQRQNKLKQRDREREETWLLFLGADHQGKEKIAKEIAKLVFGSQSKFASIALSNFVSTNSTENNRRNKRARDESAGCGSYVERLGLALNENPHRVIFMEDVEQVDYFCQKDIKQAIESGSLSLAGGEVVPLKDSIIIFSSDCDSLSSMSRLSSPSRKPKIDHHHHQQRDTDDGNPEENKNNSYLSLDLNIAIQEDNHPIGHITILESVDSQIMFKIQQL